MEDYQKLIKESAEYVEHYIKKHQTKEKLRFHNVGHTLDVVKAVQVIGEFYNLDEREQAIVSIAAYFHDTGYCAVGHQHHEDRSADFAERFLKERKVDQLMIEEIKSCILATQMPQSPKNLLEEIICDADLFHLGSEQFTSRDNLMRKEARASGNEMDKDDWRKSTLKFLQGHHYFTSYGQEFLDKKKQQNIASLINKNIDGEESK